MSSLHLILPEEKILSAEEFTAHIFQHKKKCLGVTSQESIAFCNDLSYALLNDPRAATYPALQALGFWIRPGAIVNIVRDYFHAPEATIRAPRGVVLLIAFSKIDVFFGFTLALSLLSGNMTLLYLPRHLTHEQDVLLSMIQEVLERGNPHLRERVLVIRQDDDETVLSSLSAVCHARLVWGDDDLIEKVRTLPLSSLSTESYFADRFSTCAINAHLYLHLNAPARAQIVRALFNDVYLFDQKANPSPRLLLWIGNEDDSKEAAEDLLPRLADFVEENYEHKIEGKQNWHAVDQTLEEKNIKPKSVTTYGESLRIIEIDGWRHLSAYKNLDIAYGTLLTSRLDKLIDLTYTTEKKDQTLSSWGFSPDEIHAFVNACGGGGFDRIVPIGQALVLDPVWDGCNLFDKLTRLVQITV